MVFNLARALALGLFIAAGIVWLAASEQPERGFEDLSFSRDFEGGR